MPLKTKYIEEEEVDSDEFAILQSQTELISTLKKLIGVLNNDDKNIIAQAIEKNNSAISGFVQAVKSLKFEPIINPPTVSVNSNQDIVAEAINSVTQNQMETNKLIQQLIDNRTTEWTFEVKQWTGQGRIQKVIAKAIK